ncbi:hypothetical protein ICN48_13390 [Polynucleobacter sp. JS-Safj-400b-B2]|uniref:hypothetical protein n=1 Tax=Polynucleobacter sp. JS-Safj-400b-B2 TaxID=2576921 RepID=UPI001C0DB4DF|nr:hypothetical protein [Polynucleobacter sp. JS-Safj-400b-B2]MBU3627220.1 hypothetical protein [Polynucleobacter sp. JS-Safj-400b-B2]
MAMALDGKAFDKKLFEAFCVDVPRYVRAHQKLAPPPPAGFFYVISQGSADYEIDGPLNALYVAFCLAMGRYEPIELFPMWVVYISSVYRGFKWVSRGGIRRQVPLKVPIKTLAREMNVSRDAFYDRANRVARELWRQAHELQDLSAALRRELADDLD